MTTDRPASGAHLVGSFPNAVAEDVFRVSSETLGERLRRVPDGEPSPRAGWIVAQLGMLMNHPSFETVEYDRGYGPPMALHLKPGVAADEVRFESLGYVESVLDSFECFRRLQVEGVLPGAWRFQVGFPTPLAVIAAFLHPDNKAEIEPIYEAAMLAEVEQVLAAIPHEQLAIQWDTAVEFALLEGAPAGGTAWFGDVRGGILERLTRLGNAIPTDVELGYHLCYGDSGHQHWKEPEDTSHLVFVANGVCAGTNRPVNWVHLPVPRDRDDEAYYAPLADVKLDPETELYLGLVHATGGLDATWRRIRAARTVIDDFGVATECGFSQRPPETIPEVLQIQAAVSAPIL